MNYRILGRTNLAVSALALGTVELGMDYGINAPGHFGRPTTTEAIRLVHAAVDAGINLIDTARAYGESEATLGQALHDRRARVALATKVSAHLPDGTLPTGAALQTRMLMQLEASLQLLQTDYVDLWQIHNVDRALLAEAETVAAVFADAQRSGKIRWTGGSFYGAALPAAALTHDLFDVMQVTYSVFDQRLSDQVLPQAAAQNIGVVARSVLLKGALTERADFLPEPLEPLRARSRHFRQLVAAADVKLNAAQVALAFGLAQPQIGTILVGLRTEQELHEALMAAATTLPDALLAALYPLRIDDENLINPGKWGVP